MLLNDLYKSILLCSSTTKGLFKLFLPGVDFLVGISKYLSDGHEFRDFFSFRGCFSSPVSVKLDSKKDMYATM